MDAITNSFLASFKTSTNGPQDPTSNSEENSGLHLMCHRTVR